MNDEYDGNCREWNETGMLVKEMNYIKGHEEGIQRWWYDNGKIKANYVITDHYRLLETNTDPLILGLTVLGRIRDVFKLN